ADDLGNEGDGARGARVHFEQVDHVVLDGELDVHQAADLERESEFSGLALELGNDLGRERARGQGAGGVTGVNTGFFDVLHDAGNEDILAVAEAVDVDFRCAGQISVEQQRVVAEHRIDLAGLVVRVALENIRRHEAGQGVLYVALEFLGRVDNRHGAAAEYVGRADHQRITQTLSHQASL